MPKSNSPETLLKRLEKIQRAQGRLGDITTRILAQAETLAELLKVAQGFADPVPAPAPARSRAGTAARKATSTKRATRAGASARAGTAKPATRRKPAATRGKAATGTRPRRSPRTA